MAKDFSSIPSPFDSLPDDHPVVFISYSWDSDEHKRWVKQLSDDLRTKFSVYTLLDQYNRGGYDLITFMTNAVQKANRVLLIGTPEYKRKSELYDGGGVRYEDQLISRELYHKMGTSKFIPVLRSGKFDTAFSAIIETRTGYNLVDDDYYEEVLQRLAADLWNDPMNAAPALGPIPTFIKNPFKLNGVDKTVTELTVVQFVEEIKRLLSTPNSEIPYTEMIEKESGRAYECVAMRARYNFSINPTIFLDYQLLHMKAVEKLIAAGIVIVRYGTLRQQEILVDVMVALCMKPFKNGETSVEGTTYLHLFASTFLFHTIGIACVKYGYYQILPLMMKKKVPAGHALSPTYPYPLAYLAGTNHWQPDVLNIYLDSSWLYPYSELVLRCLKPYFEAYFLNDDAYKDCFAIWEHLFSLMYVYYQSALSHDLEVFPIGLFLSERVYRKALIGGDSYSEFFKTADVEKNCWEPLKQGLFGGDYAQYKDLYGRAEAFYKRSRRW